LTTKLYGVDNNLVKHRFNDQVVNKCNCIYYKKLKELNLEKYNYASKAIMENLYLHNINIIFKQCNKIRNFRK